MRDKITDGGCSTLLVGDKSAVRDFLCALLSRPSAEQLRLAFRNPPRTVTALHESAVSERILRDGDSLLISTPVLPAGLRLTASINTEPWYERRSSDLILFLAAFPYKTMDQVITPIFDIGEHLKNRRRADCLRPTSYKVVFIRDPNRKFGAGDIVGEDAALNAYPEEIKSALRDAPEWELSPDILDFVTFRNQTDLPRLFRPESNSRLILQGLAFSSLRKWKADWREVLDDEYLFLSNSPEFERFRDQMGIERFVFDFDAAPTNFSVWDNWRYRYQRKYLDDILEQSWILYEKTTEEILFWNRERDKKTLREKVTETFADTFRKTDEIKWRDFKGTVNKTDYQQMRNRTGLDILFHAAISRFFDEELKKCLRRYLAKREAWISKFAPAFP